MWRSGPASDCGHENEPRALSTRGPAIHSRQGIALTNCDSDSAALPSPPAPLRTTPAALSGRLMIHHATKARLPHFRVFFIVFSAFRIRPVTHGDSLYRVHAALQVGKETAMRQAGTAAP